MAIDPYSVSVDPPLYGWSSITATAYANNGANFGSFARLHRGLVDRSASGRGSRGQCLLVIVQRVRSSGAGASPGCTRWLRGAPLQYAKHFGRPPNQPRTEGGPSGSGAVSSPRQPGSAAVPHGAATSPVPNASWRRPEALHPSCHARGRCVDGECGCYGVGDNEPHRLRADSAADGWAVAATGTSAGQRRAAFILISDRISRARPPQGGARMGDCVRAVDLCTRSTQGCPRLRATGRSAASRGRGVPCAFSAASRSGTLFARRSVNTDEELKWRFGGANLGTGAGGGGGDDDERAGRQAADTATVLHESIKTLAWPPLGVCWPGGAALTYWGDTTCHPADTEVGAPGGVRQPPAPTLGQQVARQMQSSRIARLPRLKRLHAPRARPSRVAARASMQHRPTCARRLPPQPHRGVPRRYLLLRFTDSWPRQGHRSLLEHASAPPTTTAPPQLQFPDRARGPAYGSSTLATGCIPVLHRPATAPPETDLRLQPRQRRLSRHSGAAEHPQEADRRGDPPEANVSSRSIGVSSGTKSTAWRLTRDALVRRLARRAARAGCPGESGRGLEPSESHMSYDSDM